VLLPLMQFHMTCIDATDPTNPVYGYLPQVVSRIILNKHKTTRTISSLGVI